MNRIVPCHGSTILAQLDEGWKSVSVWFHGERGPMEQLYTPIYFTDAEQKARGYAKCEQGGTLVKATLNLRNPKVERSAPMQIYSQEVRRLIKEGHDALIQVYGSGYDVIVLKPEVVQVIESEKV